MGVEVHIFGRDEIISKYSRIASIIASELRDTMMEQMTELSDYVRREKLSGDPLHRRSGDLSRAVTGSARVEKTLVIGQVGTKGIPYAYVHEMGGTFQIREHTRRVGFDAKSARTKLLTKQGKVRAAVKSMTRGVVNAHSATYPQRAFLHPSLEENRDKITEALRYTVRGVMHGAT